MDTTFATALVTYLAAALAAADVGSAFTPDHPSMRVAEQGVVMALSAGATPSEVSRLLHEASLEAARMVREAGGGWSFTDVASWVGFASSTTSGRIGDVVGLGEGAVPAWAHSPPAKFGDFADVPPLFTRRVWSRRSGGGVETVYLLPGGEVDESGEPYTADRERPAEVYRDGRVMEVGHSDSPAWARGVEPVADDVLVWRSTPWAHSGGCPGGYPLPVLRALGVRTPATWNGRMAVDRW